jgi:hypothetical protein
MHFSSTSVVISSNLRLLLLFCSYPYPQRHFMVTTVKKAGRRFIIFDAMVHRISAGENIWAY